MLQEVGSKNGFGFLEFAGLEQGSAERFADGKIPVRRLGVIQSILGRNCGAPMRDGLLLHAASGGDSGVQDVAGDSKYVARCVLIAKLRIRRDRGSFRSKFGLLRGSLIPISASGKSKRPRIAPKGVRAHKCGGRFGPGQNGIPLREARTPFGAIRGRLLLPLAEIGIRLPRSNPNLLRKLPRSRRIRSLAIRTQRATYLLSPATSWTPESPPLAACRSRPSRIGAPQLRPRML